MQTNDEFSTTQQQDSQIASAGEGSQAEGDNTEQSSPPLPVAPKFPAIPAPPAQAALVDGEVQPGGTTSKHDSQLMKDAIVALEEMRLKAKGQSSEAALLRDADLDMEFVASRKAVYEQLVKNFPTSVGKAVSKRERDETGQHQSTLVYGEINFESFAIALEKVKHRYGLPGQGYSGVTGFMQEPGGIFYDIGSGTGKPVFAAVCIHPFEKAIGVEILEGLYNTSLELLEQWNAQIKPTLTEQPPTEVEMAHADVTDFSLKDWSDGDVVFANSTCFDDRLMAKVADKAAALKKGAFFITLTKRLPSSHFEVLENELYQMSWGGATVYIQQKTTDPVSWEDPVVDEGDGSTTRASS